ncbi:MAG: peptidoglycan bridge formation glycyltransferase FemA/FemB family protein [Planctomycetota bacterium]|nr:peptidoglycan bridge formation glycyltransferase FemA/FemB family protein [Planctomycetota bacterium]
MNLREISDAEKDRWDQFISDSPTGHICQSYSWGEIMSLVGGPEPLRLVIEENEKIKAAFHILKNCERLSKVSVLYLPRGPVFDTNDVKTVQEVLLRLKEIALCHKAAVLKINPDITLPSHLIPPLYNAGFRNVSPDTLHKYTFRLNLQKSVDELWKSLEVRTRTAIRKAEKQLVNINVLNGVNEFEIFYKLLKATGKRKGFILPSFDFVKAVWKILSPKQHAHIFLAEYKNLPLSGAFILRFGKKCWYFLGASNTAHREVNPNEFLHWYIIQWAKEKGHHLYDLWGCENIRDTAKQVTGVTLFKRGFGGEFTGFIGEYDYAYSPVLYWTWRNILPLYQKFRDSAKALINLYE